MARSHRSRPFASFKPLVWLLAAALPGLASVPTVSLAAPLPTLSINDVTVTEGNAGTVTATFTVTQNLRGKSSVRYSTAQGTATSPADFLSRTGRLKFAGGHRTNKVAITVVGDTLDEANETFFVHLSAPVGATIADGEGKGTITDNDRTAFGLIGCHIDRSRREQRRHPGRLHRRHAFRGERQAGLRRLLDGRWVCHRGERLQPDHRDARVPSRPDEQVGPRPGRRRRFEMRATKRSTSISPTP